MRQRSNDAYLKFYYGAMGCGKTRKLQGDYHSKIEDGFSCLVLKPVIDTKGETKTLARDGGVLDSNFLIKDDTNIYDLVSNYLVTVNGVLDYIFVDEAQFLMDHHVEELADIVDKLGIAVICYGLKTDFQGSMFDGSKKLFETADSLEEIYRQCSCGNAKTKNMRLVNGEPVFEGEQVAIDGVAVTYKAVCRNCYNVAKKRVLSRKIDNNQIVIPGFEE